MEQPHLNSPNPANHKEPSIEKVGNKEASPINSGTSLERADNLIKMSQRVRKQI